MIEDTLTRIAESLEGIEAALTANLATGTPGPQPKAAPEPEPEPETETPKAPAKKAAPKARKPRKKAAAAPKDETPTQEAPPTLDALRTALKALDRATAINLLDEFNVRKLSEVKDNQIGEIMARVQEEMK